MAFIEAARRFTGSPGFKFFLILLLILLLTIPMLLVYALIWDRESRAQGIKREVSQVWGPEQRLLGPFLIVPYTVRTETVQGDKRVEQIHEHRAIFSPEVLDIDVNAQSRSLRRSIFDVPVYGARVSLKGRFAPPRLADVAAEVHSVRWRDASFVLGLSGVAGLKEAAVLRIAGAPDIPFAPSLGIPRSSFGIHAKLVSAGSLLLPDESKGLQGFAFDVDLVLNGSLSFNFAPVARETRVRLVSNWPHPSFNGAFLPDERQINATGFTAQWKIPHLARSVPEAWSQSEAGLERFQPFAFGVTLIEPVDFFGLVSRAAKYGILIIAMAFLAVFSQELTSGRRVHDVQYLFTGIALVLFFVLLLSLAEHLGFARAYAIASVVTTGMLATYIGAVMQDRIRGLVMFGVLAAMFAVLYLILQLEDYALLAGAILSFVALTIVMFATLRVDWSGGGLRKPADAA